MPAAQKIVFGFAPKRRVNNSPGASGPSRSGSHVPLSSLRAISNAWGPWGGLGR